jgi:nitrilase
MPKVALVQLPSPFLDRAAAFEVAERALSTARSEGAELVVFPETFIGGYPDWIWRLRPWSDYALTGNIHEKLLAASIDLETDDLRPLREATRRAGVHVVCGIHERDGSFSRGTLYNTMVTLGPDGALLNRHRKLVPTNPERMIWGGGDATGLRVVDASVGRLGGLICWENYMPLARFALYAQGVEIYVAPTWDHGDSWIVAMRHIAREGRCWVLGNAICMQAKDVPPDFPERAKLYPEPEEWLNPGDSVVVDPTGKVVAGPMHEERGILYATCDIAAVAPARRTLDVAGHYNRPDVFHLEVNRATSAPVRFAATSATSGQ